MKFNFCALTKFDAKSRVTSLALAGTTTPAFGLAYFSAIQLGTPSDATVMLSPEKVTFVLLNQAALARAVCCADTAKLDCASPMARNNARAGANTSAESFFITLPSN